mgnify:FL=1
MHKGSVYFIGIGGIGMSALARWFLAHGYQVSGSDLSPSSTIEELKNDGVKIFIGKHQAQNLDDQSVRVIYNQAISEDNLELQKARDFKIPTSTYPEVIGELTKLYKTVAIAGAHGKSTTASMVALILEKAKFDPTVILGTKLKEFDNKNFRSGKSDYLVLEADEWKASFLHYFPYAALITNIDREHLDFYKNLNEIKKTFLNFIDNTHKYGLLVLNKDNKNLYSLREFIKRQVVWYSIKSKEALEIKKILKLSGAHNLSNAVGAYILARALGVKKQLILKTLGSYSGAWRRSEYRGEFMGASLFDDYAHHPQEIKATLTGFKEKYKDSNIICIFQPHQRERLKILFKDFVRAFDVADQIALLEVYGVAGRDEEKIELDSRALAKSIFLRRNKEVVVISDLQELKNYFKTKIVKNKKNIVIMMGAGNINEYTDELFRIQN